MKRKRRTEECKRYLKTVEFIGGPLCGTRRKLDTRYDWFLWTTHRGKRVTYWYAIKNRKATLERVET